MPPSNTPLQRFPAGFEGLLEHHLDGLYRFALSLTRQSAEPVWSFAMLVALGAALLVAFLRDQRGRADDRRRESSSRC